MFKIGQEITKENYTQAAIWCNKNGAHIEEQGGKYVIVQNAPAAQEECALRIKELKALLTQTDYKAIKYAEGVLDETEYAEVKAQRQVWRNEINKLEGNNEDGND